MKLSKPAVFILSVSLAGTAWLACGGTVDKNQPVKSPLKVNAAATALEAPLDAAPTSDGSTFYFLAQSSGAPAIFQVSSSSGAPKLVHAGAPFVSPHSIVVATDDKSLFVADPKGGAMGGGVVFSVRVADGAVTPVAATEGLAPHALDVVIEHDADTLYFLGGLATDPAIFRLDTRTSDATMVAHGAPMVEPDGLAVSSAGVIFVADRQGKSKDRAQVFSISPKGVKPVGVPFIAGNPAGIAFTRGENELAVSALSTTTGKSQIYAIDLAHDDVMYLDDPFQENDVSGGVHRARFDQTFAWAGKSTVYNITRRPVDSSTPGGVCNMM